MAPARISTVCNKSFIGFKITGDKVETRRRTQARLGKLLDEGSVVSLPDLPSSSHPLYGSIMKLRVANSEIKQLERAITSLTKTPLNSVVFVQEDADPEYKLARMVIRRPPNPVWSVRIGEIVHNLRSALDVAVTQLSIGMPKCPPRPEFPIFVIGKTSKQGVQSFERHGHKRIKHFPAPYQTIIVGAQPYHAGNLRYRHPLWLLYELSNADKHNIVTHASMAVAGSEYLFLALPTAIQRDMATFHTNVPFTNG